MTSPALRWPSPVAVLARRALVLTALVAALVTLGCGGADPSQLRIGPAMATLRVGDDLPLAARFVIEGSSNPIDQAVTWASTDPSVVTVAGGSDDDTVAHAVAPGLAVVTATAGGFTGQALLTVEAAPPVALVVTPAELGLFVDRSAPLTATATLDDGSERDVTMMVTWTSGAPEVAGVTGAGQVTAVAAGTVTITATLGPLTDSALVTVRTPSLTSLEVTPQAPTVAVGQTRQLTATGHYDDGSMADVTATVTWTTSEPAVATVGATGLVTAIDVGTATVTATAGPIRASTAVTVEPPVVTALAIAPAGPTVPSGETQAFTATATLSDGGQLVVTTAATWTSSAPAVATVTGGGLATAVSPGDATIAAAYGGQTASTTLHVGPPRLLSITLAPTTAELAIGLTRALIATGHYGDGTTADVTATASWLSSQPTQVSVSDAVGSKGVIEARAAGGATITAVVGGVTAALDVATCRLVIDEVQVAGTSAADEWFELASTCNTAQDLGGLRVVYRSANGNNDLDVVTLAGTIAGHGHPFWVNAQVAADARYVGQAGTFSTSPTGQLAAAGGGLAIRRGAGGPIVDSMGYGTASNVFVEGTAALAPGAGMSCARVPDAVDTNDNRADFAIRTPSPGQANPP